MSGTIDCTMFGVCSRWVSFKPAAHRPTTFKSFFVTKDNDSRAGSWISADTALGAAQKAILYRHYREAQTLRVDAGTTAYTFTLTQGASR